MRPDCSGPEAALPQFLNSLDCTALELHRNTPPCVQDLKDSSKLMMASTKKLQAALGREPEEECRSQVHQLCPYLKGHTALIFTNLPHDDVQRIFEDFFHEDYARAGATAMRTVVLPEGPLEGPGGLPFPHTMEHTLRGHGLPTKLNKGVIELIAEHTVRSVRPACFCQELFCC